MDRSSTATSSPRRASTSRSECDAALVRHPQHQLLVVARAFGQRSRSRRRARRRRRSAAGCARRGSRRLSSAGVPSATMRPRSSTAMRSASWSASSRYCVVSRIGDAVGDQVADELPHDRGGCAGPGRWSARRGRSAAAAPSGSSRCRGGASCRRSRWPGSAAPPRRGRSAPAARRLRARRSAAGRCSRRPMRSRFSSPVSRLSTAENCPVTPITARTAPACAAQVVAHHAGRAGVGRDQGRQNPDDGGLARAVRPEQREDLALADVTVDAVEDDLIPVGLAQPVHGYRGACRVLG